MPRLPTVPPFALALALAFVPRAAAAVPGEGTQIVLADATAPPTSLDPFKVFGTQAQSFFRLIYAPLIDRDADGKIIAPLLERWGQVDALTWEFRLRQGVRFHDGVEVTASDVVFSLERIRDPQVGSPRRHDFAELDQILAVDRWTVRVVTKRPYALLPARLSQFSMVLPDRLRGRPEGEFFRHPIGAGPFRLVEITEDQATLSAFPDYAGGAPQIARVILRFIPDPAERVRRLLEGSVDLVTNVPPQQVDALTRARRARLVKRNSIRFMNIVVDATRGPLSQADVRRALRHGMDVEGLVRYVARGNGRPLATTALPEDFGFHPGLQPYPFDPAKARALLVQAGYPNGFRLQGIATHETKTLATAVAQQWAKLGVTLDLAVEGRAPAIARWIRERDRHDLLFLDPTSIMFDAAFHLRLTVDPGHPAARAGHPHALALLNRADVEGNPEARVALLREVQALAHEQALVLPLYQVVDLYGVGRRVKGFTPSADTILRLAGVSLLP